MGAAEIEQFLSHLATAADVSASTHNQAVSALRFLYRDVLGVAVPRLDALRAREKQRVPRIVDRATTLRIIHALPPAYQPLAGLLYGSGLRLMECVRLRVKDVDPHPLQVTVRDAKGQTDRITILPKRLVKPLENQIGYVRQLHKADLARGFGEVSLPQALARQSRNAARAPGWQWLFPADSLSEDPRAPGVWRRHHISESSLQKTVRQAVRDAGVAQPVTCHTFRHCFATHWLEDALSRGESLMAALEQVREYLGHAHLRTTMIYLHTLKKPKARSPLDDE